MKRFAALTTLLLFSATAFAAEVPVTLHSLVHDLAGASETARATARQLLPREGIDALQAVLPLLHDERQHVMHAAYNVIEQIANEAAAPGRDADQALVVEALRPLMDADQPQAIREQGLKLMTIVLPPEGDLSAIAALLDDNALRERARYALEEIGTPAAADAIARALRKSDGDFQVALLDSLGAMQQHKTLSVVERAAERGELPVRVAAVRALAWTGDAAYLPLAMTVAQEADAASRFDAVDALLRHVNAVGAAGGHVETVRAAYRDAFELADTDLLRGGALNGLGRYGDERDIAFILGAVNDANVETLGPPALSALAWQTGTAADVQLENGFGPVPLRMQIAYIDLIGRRAKPVFLPILKTAASAEDTDLRLAAFRALGASGSNEGAAVLRAALPDATDEERTLILAGLEGLAEHFAAADDRVAAGATWLAIYRATEDNAQRDRAADGLRRFPVAEAADVLIDIVNPEDIGGMPVGALAGMAAALRDAGLDAKAEEVIGVLHGKMNDAASVQQIIDYAHATGTIGDWEPRLGFVKEWHVLGPFLFSKDAGFQPPPFDPAAPDLAASHEGKDGPVSWVAHRQEGVPAHVNLMGLIGAMDNATAFVVTTIHADKAGPAEIRTGSDDGLRLWVNGEEVHANNTDRGAAVDDDIVPVTLKAGDNTLVAEICQNAGGWGFILRVSGPEGAAR